MHHTPSSNYSASSNRNYRERVMKLSHKLGSLNFEMEKEIATSNQSKERQINELDSKLFDFKQV